MGGVRGDGEGRMMQFGQYRRFRPKVDGFRLLDVFTVSQSHCACI